VEIVNADTLTPSFIAPATKQPLEFALVVSDGQDESEPSSVKITVSNRAPLASAGHTISAKRGSAVSLSGIASIDPDNDKLTYTWSQVYGTKVELFDADTANPSFHMPSTSGYLVFALSVNDGTDTSIADTVAVKSTNAAPVAKIAGISGNIESGKAVTLDGSASFDSDGDKLAYNWSQILGTPVMLDDSDSSKPSFKAPQRPDHLVFELTVNDGEKTSHSDSVVVSVKNVVKQLEVKPDRNKIARAQKAEKLTPVKRDKGVLDLAGARDAVENFLPEIAKTFVAPVQASNGHGDKHESKKSHGSHETHWSYEGDGAPSHWASLKEEFALCGNGKSQSPIDIQTQGLKQSPKPIEFHYQASAIKVVNNGHTIQANYDPGSYAVIDGKKFNLLQFHFHSPSENTIDGKPADMVAHMVHKADDGTLGVVGVLFNKGKENDFLKPIWSNLPLQAGGKTESKDTIFAANMLPENKGYYHFTGSLTTPPCSEGVNWNVMATTVEASQAQIDAFTSIFSKSVRPVQPLNDRKISFQ
ncbi:MAG: carbonic anhydrase family protein, partial [Gammaproteobacteria bacterium]|nr:carbonic anhydrase family protein [Gammaproteobacteria bacterium]